MPNPSPCSTLQNWFLNFFTGITPDPYNFVSFCGIFLVFLGGASQYFFQATGICNRMGSAIIRRCSGLYSMTELFLAFILFFFHFFVKVRYPETPVGLQPKASYYFNQKNNNEFLSFFFFVLCSLRLSNWHLQCL